MASKKKPGATRATKGGPGGRVSPPVVRPEPVRVPPFAYEPNCRQCGELLPAWALALGMCGDCLTDSQQAVRSIPGARYGASDGSSHP